MRLKAGLLVAVAALTEFRGCPESAVSRQLFGSGNRVKRLRLGGDMASEGVEDALQQLSDEWPEGAPWPCSVPRPAPSPSPASPQGDDTPAPSGAASIEDRA